MNWIKVEERLPDKKVVLVATPEFLAIGGLGDDGRWYTTEGLSKVEPTHWMPLPDPPEAE